MTIKATAGALLGMLVALWQGLPPMVAGLFALMALDMFSGLGAALIHRELSPRTAMVGMVRKSQFLILVAVGAVVDYYLYIPVPIASGVAGGVAGMLCATEVLSIVENLDRSGVPIPAVLRNALARVEQEIMLKRESNGVKS